MKNLIAITLLALIAGCSRQLQVNTEHDPAYRIDDFKTFDWGQKTNIEAGKNPLNYNELTDKRIKSAILHELTARGYVRVSEKPDRIIHYHVIVDDQSIVSMEPNGFNGAYWSRLRTYVYSHREGTLIIDLMDPGTDDLVWRGSVSAEIDTVTPDQTEKAINQGVAKIFRKFPRSNKQPDAVVSKAGQP